MIRLVSTFILLVFFFATSNIHAQNNVIDHQNHNHTSDDSHEHLITVSDQENNIDFNFKEDIHMHSVEMIALSLDEIISSDDSIDFNCTGGFCMTKSHKHKKGLSTQRQLFDYFMRISA